MQSSRDLNTNLASQKYWDDAYSDYALEAKVPDDDIVKKWILKNLEPIKSEKTCFEVGCFPGRYLTVMGDLGYTLNGLDLTPRVEKEFPEWLKKQGYKTGQFFREDFIEFKTNNKYDLVCSFGFIEHFVNWEAVLMKHISLVADNGYLVIETPNFSGWLQRFIHWYLDKENYKRHYIPSMNPNKWASICEKNGFEIVFQGYIGEFQFWVDQQPTSYVKKKVLNRFIMNYDELRKLKPGKKAYSPFCGIVAKRKI